MPELTRRYIVMAMATEGPFDMTDPESPFVLKPWKDPAALRALETYRDHCYPELAQDLDGWIKAIRSGAVARGGVGARNEAYAGSTEAKAKPERKVAPAAPPKAKVKHKSGKAKQLQSKVKRRR